MNNKLFKLFGLLVILIVALSAVSFGQTKWYVDALNGLDTYTGTSATIDGGGVGPKLTISNAITAAAIGDTISLAGIAGAPYNVEPAGSIVMSKSLVFVVTAGAVAGTPVIAANVTVTAAEKFMNGTFYLAGGFTFYINGAFTVVGSGNLTFTGMDGFAINPATNVIERALNTSKFDAIPTYQLANSIDLLYDNASITVDKEWSGTTFIYNVTANQAGATILTLAGSYTMNGKLTTPAAGTGIIALGANTLTMNDAVGFSHDNYNNITSTNVGVGGITVGTTTALTTTFLRNGQLPNISKTGAGLLTLTATTVVNGNITTSAAAGNVLLSAVVTITGGITHAGTATSLFTVTPSVDVAGNVASSGAGGMLFSGALGNTAATGGSLTNSGTGTVTVTGTSWIGVNVVNSGPITAGVSATTNGRIVLTGASTILGYVQNMGSITGATTTGSGLITFTGAAVISGAVKNTVTITAAINATPVAGPNNSGIIAFANNATITGATWNNPTLSNSVTGSGGNGLITNNGNITFGDKNNTLTGGLQNNGVFSGTSNSTTAGQSGITASGNVTFGNTITANGFITAGLIDNSPTSTFATASTAAGNFSNNGNITVPGLTTAVLNFAGGVQNNSQGFTFVGTVAMANVILPATRTSLLTIGVNATTLGNVTLGSTCAATGNVNGNIDLGAASIGGITHYGNVSASGAGNGKINYDVGALTITGTGAGNVTNSRTVAGSDILFNGAAVTVSITGTVSVTSAGNVTFAATTAGGTFTIGALSNSGTGKIQALALANIGAVTATITNGVTMSGTGSILLGTTGSTMAGPLSIGGTLSVSGGIFRTGTTGVATATTTLGALSISGGLADFSIGNSTRFITVNGNYTHTSGTLALGTGARALNVLGATATVTSSASVTPSAATNLTTLTFGTGVGTDVRQLFNVSSGGTAIWPGLMVVNNGFVGDSAWTLVNGNLRVRNVGGVTFTAGVVVLHGTTLFIEGAFNYNTPVAQAYRTNTVGTREGFISMATATIATTTVTTTTANQVFSNIEFDNSGQTVDLSSAQNYVFKRVFALTSGNVTVSGGGAIIFNNTNPFPTIRRNVGTLGAVPNYAGSSAVDVVYLSSANIVSGNELLLAETLNNLFVQMVGADHVLQLANAITVNGQLTIGGTQVYNPSLDLNGQILTMGGAALVGRTTPNAIIFTNPVANNKSKILDVATGASIVLNDLNGGTRIQGMGSVDVDANSNTIVATAGITVANGSWGNVITGIRQITSNLAMSATAGSLTMGFVNGTAAAATYQNIVGTLTLAATDSLTLSSKVRVSSNLTTTGGYFNLGSFNLEIVGNTNAMAGTATTFATGQTGKLRFVNIAGGTTLTVNTGTLVVPNLDIATTIASDFTLTAGAGSPALEVSNTFLHTSGTIQLGGPGAINLTVSGNVYTVPDKDNAIIGATGLGTLVLQPTTGTLSWTINDAVVGAAADYAILNMTENGNVTLTGAATVTGVSISGVFTHTAGLLTFGAKNITMAATAGATFTRAAGTYNGTGYLIWSGTTAANFTNGTLMVIPNFRITANATLQTASSMTVVNNLDLNAATLTHTVGIVPELIVGQNGQPVPTINVTSAGDLDAVPTFSLGQTNYTFSGAALGVSLFYWPLAPTTLAQNVTLTMAAAANAVTDGSGRTINVSLTLTQGVWNVATGVTTAFASGATITVTNNGSTNLTGVGTFFEPNINLVYIGGAAVATGFEYSQPSTTGIASLTVSGAGTILTIGSAQTIAGTATLGGAGVVINAATTFGGAATASSPLTINAATFFNGTLGLTAAATVAADISLTTNGVVTVGNGGNVALLAAATAVSPGTRWNVNGNVAVTGTGTLTLNPGAPLNDFVVFGGGVGQTFGLNANYLIDNINVTMAADSVVTVSGGNLTAVNNLALNRGILYMGGQSILVLASATGAVEGFTQSTTFITFVYGLVQKPVVQGQYGRFEFPLGSLQVRKLRPAAINFSPTNLVQTNTNLVIAAYDSLPGGANALPLDGDGVTIGSASPYYWIVYSTPFSLGVTQKYDVELKGTNLLRPVSNVNLLRNIQRADAAAPYNPWRLIGTAAGYAGQNFMQQFPNGDTTVVVRCVGASGAITQEKSRFAIGIPSQAPGITAAMGNQTISEGSSLTFTFAATDADVGIGSPVWSIVSPATLPRNMSIGASTGGLALFTFNPDVFQSGTYTVKFRASKAGAPTVYTDTTSIIIVTEFNRAPQWTAAGPPVVAPAWVPFSVMGNTTLAARQTLGFTYKAWDADTDVTLITPLVYTKNPISTAPAGLTVSTSGVVSWTPAVADTGTFTLVVSVSDGIAPLVNAAAATITVTRIPRQVYFPLATTISNFTASMGASLSFSVAAADSDGLALTYSLTQAPAGALVSSAGVFTWTVPFGPQGTYKDTVTVRATNGSYPATQTFIITRNFVNVGPHFATVLTNRTLLVGDTLKFKYTATDQNNDVLTFSGNKSYLPYPQGMTIDAQGNLFWVATGTQTAVYYVSSYVSDGLASDSTWALVTVQVTTVNVTGKVTYSTGTTPVAGALVSLTRTGGSTLTATTDNTGSYAFNGVISGAYTLGVTKTTNYPGIYVNAADALRAALAGLSQVTLTPLQTLAGDVNRDLVVTSADALLIMIRYVNGTPNANWTAPDWVFLPATVNFNLYTANYVDNVMALAAGDVNADAQASGYFAKAEGTASVQMMSGQAMKINPSDEFELPVRVQAATSLGAMALKFDYPADVATFVGVRGPEGMMSAANNGVVTVAWFNTDNALNLQKNDAIVTLRFKPLPNIKSFDVTLDPSSQVTDAKGTVLNGINLEIASVDGTVPTVFALGQNYPNPFNPSTTIQYDMPVAGHVTLAVYNTLGQVIDRLVDNEQNAGSYKIRWDASRVSSGIYMYQITVDAGKQTFKEVRRMVLLK